MRAVRAWWARLSTTERAMYGSAIASACIAAVTAIVVAVIQVAGVLVTARESGSRPAERLPTAAAAPTASAATPTTSAPQPGDAGADQGSATPTPARSAPSDCVSSYTANWSSGSSAWLTTGDWKTVTGMLVNDGTSPDERMNAVAPVTACGNDYAVEAEVQLISYTGLHTSSFGVVLRVSDAGGGYAGGYECAYYGYTCNFGDPYQDEHAAAWVVEDGRPGLKTFRFAPKQGWHTYRIEARGNQLTVIVDGRAIGTATDNKYLEGSAIGMWCFHAQINVRAFRLVPLT